LPRVFAALVCAAVSLAAGARAESRQAIVASHPLAAQAGHDILRAGGSAIDAAIAAQWVLGLVEPQSSGLGGGGFLLHWSEAERRVRSYDGRETAPAAARPERFLAANGEPLGLRAAAASGLAVGVPGLVAMLEHVHRRHGRLPWARLTEPALALAEQGYAVSPRLAAALAQAEHLDATARALWSGGDGRLLAPGERAFNLEYAHTLRAIGREGAEAFYRGALAEGIVRAVRTHALPGDLALSDLAAYRAREREPLCGRYRRWRVCSAGPPSSGGLALLQILGILERTAFHRAAPFSPEAVHLFSEAARLAYADRARYAADPDFVPQPLRALLAPSYLAHRAAAIGERSLGRAQPGDLPRAPAPLPYLPAPLGGTTHLSVVDAWGDAVALTSSVEQPFGSGIAVGGFVLNSQLTDFAFEPRLGGRSVANRVEAGKRPRSSMTPTFVFDAQGRLAVVLGSPGGAVIPLYVARTLVALLDWGLDPVAAVAAPHFGSTNGPTLIERDSAALAWEDALRARGHTIERAAMPSGLAVLARRGQGWQGAADPRRAGAVLGD